MTTSFIDTSTLKLPEPFNSRQQSNAHLAPLLGGVHGQDDDQPLAGLQPGLIRRQRVLLPREPADTARHPNMSEH